MNVTSLFISYSQTTLLMKPTDRAFDDVANDSKPTSMFRASFGKERLDAQPSQDGSRRFAIIRAIGVQLLRPRSRMPGLAAHGGQVCDERHELRDVSFVGAGNPNLQGHTLTIDDQVVLGAGLPAIGRVWAGLLATAHGPHTAAVCGRPRPVDFARGIEFR